VLSDFVRPRSLASDHAEPDPLLASLRAAPTTLLPALAPALVHERWPRASAVANLSVPAPPVTSGIEEERAKPSFADPGRRDRGVVFVADFSRGVMSNALSPAAEAVRGRLVVLGGVRHRPAEPTGRNGGGLLARRSEVKATGTERGGGLRARVLGDGLELITEPNKDRTFSDIFEELAASSSEQLLPLGYTRSKSL